MATGDEEQLKTTNKATDFQVHSLLVSIGFGTQHFIVPLTILRKTSSILNKHTKPALLHGNIPALKDILPEDFNTYLNWAYHGTINIKPAGTDLDAEDPRYHFLFGIYFVGRLLEDVRFQKAVLQEIVAEDNDKLAGGGRSIPGHATARLLYSVVGEAPDLRRLLVKLYRRGAGKEDVAPALELPTAFLQDLVFAFAEERGGVGLLIEVEDVLFVADENSRYALSHTLRRTMGEYWASKKEMPKPKPHELSHS